MQCKPTGKDQQKNKYGYRELSQSPCCRAINSFFLHHLVPVVPSGFQNIKLTLMLSPACDKTLD